MDSYQDFLKALTLEVEEATRDGAVLCLSVVHFDEEAANTDSNSFLRELYYVLRSEADMLATIIPYASDGIVFLMPRLHPQDALEACERARMAVGAHTFETGEQQVKTTVSMGLASFPADGLDVDSLVAAGFDAMNRAIAAGGNRCVRFAQTAD